MNDGFLGKMMNGLQDRLQDAAPELGQYAQSRMGGGSKAQNAAAFGNLIGALFPGAPGGGTIGGMVAGGLLAVDGLDNGKSAGAMAQPFAILAASLMQFFGARKAEKAEAQQQEQAAAWAAAVAPRNQADQQALATTVKAAAGDLSQIVAQPLQAAPRIEVDGQPASQSFQSGLYRYDLRDDGSLYVFDKASGDSMTIETKGDEVSMENGGEQNVFALNGKPAAIGLLDDTFLVMRPAADGNVEMSVWKRDGVVAFEPDGGSQVEGADSAAHDRFAQTLTQAMESGRMMDLAAEQARAAAPQQTAQTGSD
ncbi:MAG: hypothetical protein R3316_10715 [Rhodovibrionaceae bacterium]|nr:hypothetical protein [Rhodovibrionaceae bacterium]